MNKCSILCLASLLAATCPVFSGEKTDLSKLDLSKLPAPSETKGLTYAKDIKPMLQASCFRCHGGERVKGGLKLTSLEDVLKGGDDGKVIVAGDGKASLLVIAASRIDDETAMPPKRGPGGRGPSGRGPGGPGGTGDGSGGPPPGGQPDQAPPGAGPGGPGGPGRGGFGPPPKALTAEQV